MIASRAILYVVTWLAAIAAFGADAYAQTLNPAALATVNGGMCRIDKSDLGWTSGMVMTPYNWVRHPSMKNSYYFNGIVVDPEKGAALLYQIGAGEGVMQSVREGAAERDAVLKYITLNYHVQEKLVLGKDQSDRGYSRLYAVSGTQGEMKTLGWAGYAKGYLLYFAYNVDPKKPLDPAWLDRVFTKWLARFPNLEGAEKLAVRVFPSMQDLASDEGLTPAAEQLPAKLKVQGLAADVPLTVSIPATAAAELRANGATSGRTITMKADESGRAEILLVPKVADRAAKPFTVKVHIQPAQGTALDATVHVGLDLDFTTVMPVKGDGLNKTLAPWPLLIAVKSRSQPALNLGEYLMRAEDQKVWNGLTLGVDLKTEWLNQPATSPDDSVYWATTNIYFHGKLGASTTFTGTVLSANGDPSYQVASFNYPAVILKSGGEHVYRIAALPVAMKVSDKTGKDTQRKGAVTGEPWMPHSRVVVLSGNDPYGWFDFFQMGACALEPVDADQEIYIGILKTFPVTAPLVDEITGAASIACNVAKGEYAAAFLDLAKTLGTKYIEKLADENVVKGLTAREQELVKLGKMITDEVDKSEKEEERDKLLKNLTKKYDAQIKALYR